MCDRTTCLNIIALPHFKVLSHNIHYAGMTYTKEAADFRQWHKLDNVLHNKVHFKHLLLGAYVVGLYNCFFVLKMCYVTRTEICTV